MQFSETWLRSFVSPPLDSAQLAHLLTMAGLEVEEMRAAAPAFSGVVVAQVLAVDKHPDADKLRLCRVDIGQGGPLQIVCGAPNVAPGMKVPCALVGARLPGLEIKAAKVRGVESFGMLCSARELGLSEDQGGLLALAAVAPVGRDIREWLDLDDRIVTIKLTPNRADCLSLLGVAREVAALTGVAMTPPALSEAAVTSQGWRDILLDAPEACPRFCGRVVSGIDARAPTPEWMKTRLERSGIRAISAVVDVTNYVMLELGQPMHAYDNARLSGAMHARFARTGEKLLLLNEQSIDLTEEMLVIADDARVLGLAGIMGGEESGIGLGTSELFLEAAFFAPEVVAGKARALGFSSDASYRFERGVDFAGCRAAIERATQLILDICGGAAGPVVDSRAELPPRPPVRLRAARAARVLGIELAPAQIRSLLEGLGFACEQCGDEFMATPPSYRFDIAVEEDLIEELARLHGYDNIPARTPLGRLAMLPRPEAARDAMQVKRLLAARDYQEVINFSFVDSAWEADFCANAKPVVLANPIASQMSVMRSSLIGGLVGALATNLKRRVDRARLFEVGRCFLRDGAGDAIPGFLQPLRLAALAAGPAAAEQWGLATRRVDFFDLKADVEVLVAPRTMRYERVAHPALHPGRAASIVLDGKAVGIVGEIHPRWVQKYELGSAPVVFEIELDALLARELPAFKAASRFPAVVRDLALVVPQDVSAQAVVDGLRAGAPAIVRSIELFDVYHGEGIGVGQKSLAFRVVMQDTERTLTDSEVDAAKAVLIESAATEFGGKLRQ